MEERAVLERVRQCDNIDPGEEHWHGATRGRFTAHLAIQDADDHGEVVTWLEHVTDEEYATAAAAHH